MLPKNPIRENRFSISMCKCEDQLEERGNVEIKENKQTNESTNTTRRLGCFERYVQTRIYDKCQVCAMWYVW